MDLFFEFLGYCIVCYLGAFIHNQGYKQGIAVQEIKIEARDKIIDGLKVQLRKKYESQKREDF